MSNMYDKILGVDHVIKYYDNETHKKMYAVTNMKDRFILRNNSKNNYMIDIVHHNDLDGVASASMINIGIREMIPELHSNKQINYISYNYKKPIWEVLNELQPEDNGYINRSFKVLFVVDVSLKSDEIEYLCDNQYYDRVVWIDHHVSSFDYLFGFVKYHDKYSKFNSKFKVLLDNRYSAAYIAFHLLISRSIYKDDLVKYIDSYDMKKDIENPDLYKLGVYINALYGSDQYGLRPSSSLWYEMIYNEDKLKEMLDIGKEYRELDIKKIKLFQKYTKLIEVDLVNGYKFMAYETGSGNSFKFDGIKYDIACIIKDIGNNKYQFSLYSDDELIKNINLGKVMKEKFNGGGHPGAAGGTYTIISKSSIGNRVDIVIDRIVGALNQYITK